MPDEEGSVSLPTFRLPEGADRADPAAWEFGMEEFQAPPPKRLPEVSPDDLFVARLSRFQVKPGTQWQQGAVFSPNPIVDQGQPVYPVVGLIGVTETGRAEGVEAFSSQLDRAIVIRRSFTKAVEAIGYLPEELMVGSPIAELALKEFAQQTGVRLKAGTGGMPLFEHIADDLLSSPLFRSPNDDLPAAFDDISPEKLQDLDGLLRKAAAAGAGDPEIGKILEEFMEDEEGAEILRQFAATMGDGSGFGELFDMPGPGSGSSSESQLELVVPEPVDSDRYVMRIDLVGMKPPIWRRISLPAEATFHDLHLAIQAAFDWDDSHLHEFQLRERNQIIAVVGQRELDSNACFKDTETKLKQIFTANIHKMNYLYDFGDDWDHLIKIEKKIPAEAGQTGPECHAGRGIAPPEDCGGIWGYRQLLDGTSEIAGNFDDEYLSHLREGKFSPKDVKF